MTCALCHFLLFLPLVYKTLSCHSLTGPKTTNGTTTTKKHSKSSEVFVIAFESVHKMGMSTIYFNLMTRALRPGDEVAFSQETGA